MMTSSAIIRQGVIVKQYIKNTLGILTIALAASAAAAGEIEQFISETMAERRAQNARERNQIRDSTDCFARKQIIGKNKVVKVPQL